MGSLPPHQGITRRVHWDNRSTRWDISAENSNRRIRDRQSWVPAEALRAASARRWRLDCSSHANEFARLDKKIALISHKKVANRVDAFGVLVTGGWPARFLLWELGPLQPWGPPFCAALRKKWWLPWPRHEGLRGLGGSRPRSQTRPWTQTGECGSALDLKKAYQFTIVLVCSAEMRRGGLRRTSPSYRSYCASGHQCLWSAVAIRQAAEF